MCENSLPGILIVEDDESNYLYLKVVLSKLNATIWWAKDGLEALSVCDKNDSIRLVLMDLYLPVMDGYEATRILKTRLPLLPIVAQTASAMLGDKEKAMKAGCDDYLAKPIKTNDLLAVVNKYIIF